MGSVQGAYVVLGLIFLGVLSAVMLYRIQLRRERIERWRELARSDGLVYTSRGLLQMGTISGEYRGRRLEIRSVTHRMKGLESLKAEGIEVQICLDPVLRPLHFRRETAADKVPLLGSPEVEVGDAVLDPLLRLMGVDSERYRQLISQGPVRACLLRAYDLNGVLVVKDGSLRLARPIVSVDYVYSLVDEALEIADALETADGSGWRQAASAFQLELRQDESEWIMRCTGENEQIFCRYWSGTSNGTRIEVRLPDALQSLRIDRRDIERPGQRTGDPILDSSVHLSGVSDFWMSQWCKHGEFTECVMHLIKGMKGRVEDGSIGIERAGLIADPGSVIADFLVLAEILESSLSDLSAED